MKSFWKDNQYFKISLYAIFVVVVHDAGMKWCAYKWSCIYKIHTFLSPQIIFILYFINKYKKIN